MNIYPIDEIEETLANHDCKLWTKGFCTCQRLEKDLAELREQSQAELREQSQQDYLDMLSADIEY